MRSLYVIWHPIGEEPLLRSSKRQHTKLLAGMVSVVMTYTCERGLGNIGFCRRSRHGGLSGRKLAASCVFEQRPIQKESQIKGV